MPLPRSLTALAAALLLTACTGPGRYPLTGAASAPADPVLTLDAGDFAAAPIGTGTF